MPTPPTIFNSNSEIIRVARMTQDDFSQWDISSKDTYNDFSKTMMTRSLILIQVLVIKKDSQVTGATQKWRYSPIHSPE